MNKILGWVACMCLILSAGKAIAKQPNVIVFLTDDQGWGDVSFNGNTNLATPNIDSIAREGARFDRFYVCPVCAPTRAEFLTGRYHPRGKVRGVSEGLERLDLSERTMAQEFKSAGYATAAFGKWHNGTQFPYHPRARGFDEFYGFCSGHWGDYFSPPLDHNGVPTRGNGYLVDDFTDHALKFIEANAKQEFFLYLPYPTPHAPMQVPDEYWDRFKERSLSMTAREDQEEDMDFTRAALAMVECIDANIGRVLRKLDELDLADDTIVVFFTDNGPNSWRWNGAMKGRKGSTDEGGVRSPLFIRWPGQIKANKLVLQVSGAIDLLPTLADLAEIPLLGNKPLDGVSLKPLLMGTQGSIPDRMIFSHWNKRVSVRTQHHRLDHSGKLFDMVADPEQRQDVSSKFPEVAQELSDYVIRWRKEMAIDQAQETEPFTVGFDEFPLTWLPARDGVPHGEIKRSAPAPNCSYFTNWKRTSDTITWNIDVLTAGNYEVVAEITCPESAVGSEIALTDGKSVASAVVTDAHDPPATGDEHDRVPRNTESLVKEFSPLTLGKISLTKGACELTLSSPRLEGNGGIEVRTVYLRRKR